MFDVQAGRRTIELPAEVLDSIAAYYRRVTTTSRPMSRLIAAAMVVTLGALLAEVIIDDARRSAAAASLALTTFAVGLAVGRTVRGAVRLGSQVDDRQRQSALAHRIY